MPFVLALADKGFAQALMSDPCLHTSLKIHNGHVTHKAVADALGMPYFPTSEALKF